MRDFVVDLAPIVRRRGRELSDLAGAWSLLERFVDDGLVRIDGTVLAVTDPTGVAARVDGVIVCMRLSRHTRELGKRTIESLRDIGATVAGIVINGVEERDAYGYGNYRYTDYRNYYKNYNYKYGYGRYGSYNSYTETEGSEYYSDDRAGQSRTQPAAITAETRPEESPEDDRKAD